MKRVTKDQLVTSFDASNPPALRVKPGETFAECAFDATFRISIEDSFTLRRPVVTNENEVMTTGEADTMEAATKMAIDAMADLMADRLGVDYTSAAMLIASAADVRTGLAGNPPYTIRVAIPTSVLTI